LKKPTGSVRFWFFKPGTGKTEPKTKPEKNRAKPKKPSQTKKTESNRKKPSQTEKTEPNRFEPVFFSKKPNRNRSV
jgi:hypothetical protein